MHFLQVQNRGGLVSNDYVFFADHAPAPSDPGANLIASGGTFSFRGQWQTVTNNGSVSWNGQAEFRIEAASANPWHVQLSHDLSVASGQSYAVCYDARARGQRIITVNSRYVAVRLPQPDGR